MWSQDLDIIFRHVKEKNRKEKKIIMYQNIRTLGDSSL